MPKFPATDDAPPVPPVRPDNDECCNSGCSPCVFDLYEEEVERYRAALSAWEARNKDRKKNGGKATSR
jgi:hypothetical protein